MLEHPCARAGILENNPVHEDMVEHARMAGLDFVVNVLLNTDEEITHVFSGDMADAHEAGCRQAGDVLSVTVDKLSDITLTTNGGAPLDLDFYQTCKAIDTAARVTRAGGVIIVASSCSDGIGPEEFRELHASAKSPEELLTALSCDDAHAGGVSWQNQLLARAQVDHHIFLLSGLDDDAVKSMMVTPIDSIESGLEEAYNSTGGGTMLNVIPRGPLVLPIIDYK
jgi:nickel-dependent lactate racemase